MSTIKEVSAERDELREMLWQVLDGLGCSNATPDYIRCRGLVVALEREHDQPWGYCAQHAPKGARSISEWRPTDNDDREDGPRC